LLHLEEPLELLTLEHRILIVYDARLLLDLRRLLGCLECLALLHHQILLLGQLLLLLRGRQWLHLHWLRAERLHGLMRLLHLACLLVELHEVGMHVATLNLRRVATQNFVCHLQHLHMTHLTEVWLSSLDDLGLSNGVVLLGRHHVDLLSCGLAGHGLGSHVLLGHQLLEVLLHRWLLSVLILLS
jgi:hypothetical protein